MRQGKQLFHDKLFLEQQVIFGATSSLQKNQCLGSSFTSGLELGTVAAEFKLTKSTRDMDGFPLQLETAQL